MKGAHMYMETLRSHIRLQGMRNTHNLAFHPLFRVKLDWRQLHATVPDIHSYHYQNYL